MLRLRSGHSEARFRYRDERLDAGDELRDGAQRYVVERVEQAPNRDALGHVWTQVVVAGCRRVYVRARGRVDADSTDGRWS